MKWLAYSNACLSPRLWFLSLGSSFQQNWRGLLTLPTTGHCYFLFLGSLHYPTFEFLQIFCEGRIGSLLPFSARAWYQELSPHIGPGKFLLCPKLPCQNLYSENNNAPAWVVCQAHLPGSESPLFFLCLNTVRAALGQGWAPKRWITWLLVSCVSSVLNRLFRVSMYTSHGSGPALQRPPPGCRLAGPLLVEDSLWPWKSPPVPTMTSIRLGLSVLVLLFQVICKGSQFCPPGSLVLISLPWHEHTRNFCTSLIPTHVVLFQTAS